MKQESERSKKSLVDYPHAVSCEKPSKPNYPCAKPPTPSTTSLLKKARSSSYTHRAIFVPFAVKSSRVSEDGDKVEVQFSDQTFTFLTSWLYLSRQSEGLPAPGGCKNPSKIHIRCVKVSGVGVRATVDITWNTGTTSQFPALLLRVFGPTKALGQKRCEERPPELGGRNPRSGVGQLTLDEKRVADRYRGMLVDKIKGYVVEEWILKAPTSLLKEMARYVEIEIQNEPVTAQTPAAEVPYNDAAVRSISDDLLMCL